MELQNLIWEQMICIRKAKRVPVICSHRRARAIALSTLLGLCFFATIGCRRSIKISADSELERVYRVEKPTWSSTLILKGDHTSVQYLIIGEKIEKQVNGKWNINEPDTSLASYEVSISSCIDLHGNLKDNPGVRASDSLFGKEVSERFPIQRNLFSKMILVIDEEEDLEFTKKDEPRTQ